MMTELYRVENAEGEGLYSGDGAERVWGSTFARPGNPMPWEDPDPVFQTLFRPGFLGGERKAPEIKKWKTAKFAFPSIEAAAKWIDKPEDRVKFAELGFKIGVYSAPDKVARIGVTQAVFDKTKAKLEKTIPLTELE